MAAAVVLYRAKACAPGYHLGALELAYFQAAQKCDGSREIASGGSPEHKTRQTGLNYYAEASLD